MHLNRTVLALCGIKELSNNDNERYVGALFVSSKARVGEVHS